MKYRSEWHELSMSRESNGDLLWLLINTFVWPCQRLHGLRMTYKDDLPARLHIPLPHRIVLIIVIILCFIAACTLQTVRVLKQQYGMTTQEIEALILGWMGLRHKDEL